MITVIMWMCQEKTSSGDVAEICDRCGDLYRILCMCIVYVLSSYGGKHIFKCIYL